MLIRERRAFLEEESESKIDSVVPNSLRLRDLYSPWNSPGQNTGVGSLSLLQGIFPTQEMNPGILHCRQIHYQLSQGETNQFSFCCLPTKVWAARLGEQAYAGQG